MEKWDILFGNVIFWLCENFIILHTISACVLITTQAGITLMIMKLNLIKSGINAGAFSKLESSIRSFPVIHDSSSFALDSIITQHCIL